MLILACDGLWDVMSSEDAINTLRGLYATGERDIRKIAEEMLDISLDKGKVLVLFLNVADTDIFTDNDRFKR